VPALLRQRARLTPDDPAHWSLTSDGQWKRTTWCDAAAAVAAAARGLRTLGLKPGDRFGILAPSSARWDIAQLAAMAAGCAVVGLDPHDTTERLGRVAALCDLTAIVVQDAALLERLPPIIRQRLRLRLSFAAPTAPDLIAFDDLARGAPAAVADEDWDRSQAGDAALIVFTSGTTGAPKGIVYDHQQTCGAIASILQTFPDIAPGSRLACWLPLANLFQRMINLCAIGRGAQTYYVEDPRSIMQHVGRIAPHLLIGVPRFYEKLHAGIQTRIAAAPAWQRALAGWAITAGERRAAARREQRPLGNVDRLAVALADRLALNRIRSSLGANLRFLVSGSAPMPPWLLERLHGIGWLVLEAYGLSESIVPVAANQPDRFRFGSVGRPLPSVEIRLAADGELLLRGPGVSTTYLGEATAPERMDADGYLASGDYASVDEDGFISLRGRKSELIKTSTGRRIAPAEIEGQLRQVPDVEHAVVFGTNRPFLTALLALSEAAPKDPAALAASARAQIADAVETLPGYQRPAGVLLSRRALSIAEGHLTPNLKLRRARIEEDFRGELDALYELLSGEREPARARELGDVLLLSL